MPLPANDAFTLGLIHDEKRTHSRSRSLTRSPSPKIPIATSRVERGLARRASKRGSASSNWSTDAGPDAPLAEIEEKREDSPVSVPNSLAKKTQEAAIDWEIPRKLLHSSIGGVFKSNSNDLISDRVA